MIKITIGIHHFQKFNIHIQNSFIQIMETPFWISRQKNTITFPAKFWMLSLFQKSFHFDFYIFNDFFQFLIDER